MRCWVPFKVWGWFSSYGLNFMANFWINSAIFSPGFFLQFLAPKIVKSLQRIFILIYCLQSNKLNIFIFYHTRAIFISEKNVFGNWRAWIAYTVTDKANRSFEWGLIVIKRKELFLLSKLKCPLLLKQLRKGMEKWMNVYIECQMKTSQDRNAFFQTENIFSELNWQKRHHRTCLHGQVKTQY